MPASRIKGRCELCGQDFAKAGMRRHLQSCLQKHDAKGVSQELLLLRIEAVHDSRYWLYLEMPSRTPIEQLDDYLRDIWLECCGHMSAFFLGRAEVAMSTPAGRGLGGTDRQFAYEYDFGSTTSLKGRTLATRQGAASQSAIRLLARNAPLPWQCESCCNPATIICPFCMHDSEALFCEEHADRHEHADEEFYLPVVNSPRMGVCGYAG